MSPLRSNAILLSMALIPIIISSATFSQNIFSKFQRKEEIIFPTSISSSMNKYAMSSTSLRFRDDPFGLGIDIYEDLGYTNAAMESLGLSMSGKLDLNHLLKSALHSIKTQKQVVEVGQTSSIVKKDSFSSDFVKGKQIYVVSLNTDSQGQMATVNSTLPLMASKDYFFADYAKRRETKFTKSTYYKNGDLEQPINAPENSSTSIKQDVKRESNLIPKIESTQNELDNESIKEVQSLSMVKKDYFFADYVEKRASKLKQLDSIENELQDQAIIEPRKSSSSINKELYFANYAKTKKIQDETIRNGALKTSSIDIDTETKKVKSNSLTNKTQDKVLENIKNSFFFADLSKKSKIKKKNFFFVDYVPNSDLKAKKLDSVSNKKEKQSSIIENLNLTKNDLFFADYVSNMDFKRNLFFADYASKMEFKSTDKIVLPNTNEIYSVDNDDVDDRKKRIAIREAEIQNMASRKRIQEILAEQEREATKRAEAASFEEERRRQEHERETERRRIESMKREMERIAAERERERKYELEKLKRLSQSAERDKKLLADAEKEMKSILAEAKKERQLIVEAKREMNNLLAGTLSPDEINLERERRKSEFDQLFPLKQKEKNYNVTQNIVKGDVVVDTSTYTRIDELQDVVFDDGIDELVSAVQPKTDESVSPQQETIPKFNTTSSKRDGKSSNNVVKFSTSKKFDATGVNINKSYVSKLLDKVSAIESEMEKKIEKIITETNDVISSKFSSFASDQLISRPETIDENFEVIEQTGEMDLQDSKNVSLVPLSLTTSMSPSSNRSSKIVRTQPVQDTLARFKDRDLNEKIDELKRIKKLNEEKIFARTKVLEEKQRRQAKQENAIAIVSVIADNDGVEKLSEYYSDDSQSSQTETKVESNSLLESIIKPNTTLLVEECSLERKDKESSVYNHFHEKFKKGLIKNDAKDVMNNPDSHDQTLRIDLKQMTNHFGRTVPRKLDSPQTTGSLLFSLKPSRSIFHDRITLHKLSSIRSIRDYGLNLQQINILQKARRNSTFVSLKLLAYIFSCTRRSILYRNEVNKAYEIKKDILIEKFKFSEDVQDRTLSNLLYLGLMDVHKNPKSCNVHEEEFATLNHIFSSALLLTLISMFEAGKNLTVGERMAIFAFIVRSKFVSHATSAVTKSSLYFYQNLETYKK